MLYRCVQAVNLSHDNAHAQMDVKLRSLICMGLNEQVLHLWLEVLCSCSEVVQKWYCGRYKLNLFDVFRGYFQVPSMVFRVQSRVGADKM